MEGSVYYGVYMTNVGGVNPDECENYVSISVRIVEGMTLPPKTVPVAIGVAA